MTMKIGVIGVQHNDATSLFAAAKSAGKDIGLVPIPEGLNTSEMKVFVTENKIECIVTDDISKHLSGHSELLELALKMQIAEVNPFNIDQAKDI